MKQTNEQGHTVNSFASGGAQFNSISADVHFDDQEGFHKMCYGFYIGTGGDLEVETIDGSILLFRNIPDGSHLPVLTKRIISDQTSVQHIIAYK